MKIELVDNKLFPEIEAQLDSDKRIAFAISRSEDNGDEYLFIALMDSTCVLLGRGDNIINVGDFFHT